MRTIEFRGKRLDNRVWIYGSLIVYTNLEGNRNTYIVDDSGNIYEVDPTTVGQYTGLKDNTSQKIFEGDVLRMYDNKRYSFTCIYRQSHSAFLGQCNETRLGLANVTERVSKEIIGNVHDNPELL